MNSCIGIDVSKSRLDCFACAGEESKSEANSSDGIKKLVQWAKEKKPDYVVMESTGSYQTAVAQALYDAGIQICIVPPQRIRKFCESMGQIAKTDKIDCRMIAEYGSVHKKLRPFIFQSKERQELDALRRRREQLMQMRIGELNRMHVASESLKASLKRMIKVLDREISGIDKQIAKGVAKDETLKRRAEIIDSVKGFGEISANLLGVSLPELGTLSREKISSLAGLSPFNKDSANTIGKRKTFAGRASVRSALYMSAMTAIRWNPDVKTFYQRLRSRGKEKMVALVACMRKLLIMLNALVKCDRCWTPEKPKRSLPAAA